MPTDNTRGQNTESTETTDVRYRPVVQNRIVQISQQARDEEGGGISDEAVKAFAKEHGMSEKVARETILRYQAGGDEGEFKALSESTRASLEAAASGGSPYEIAPETIASGGKVAVRTESGEIVETKLAPTPEQQAIKISERQRAIETLSRAGLVSPIDKSTISPDAYLRAESDKIVKQALYNVGLSDKQIRQGATQMRAYNEYQKRASEFITNQVAQGYAKNKKEAERQLADIQSGEYMAYMPDLAEPENVKKGQYVTVWREYVEEREKSGLSPAELGQVYSGNYVIELAGNKIPVTKAQYQLYTTDKEKRAEATKNLAKVGFVKVQYPQGGAPFELYTETGAKQLDIPSLAEYVRKDAKNINTLRNYGFDDKVISAISEYNTELKNVIKAVDTLLSPSISAKGTSAFNSEKLSLQNAIVALGITGVPGATMPARSTVWIDGKTNKVLTNSEVLKRVWDALSDANKETVARAWANDYFKSSMFAETVKQQSDRAAQMGIGGQLLYAPVLPVVTPVAKQITIDDAREILSKNYATELTVLSGYVKSNGTFDINKLDKDIKANPQLGRVILNQTGYVDIKTLKQGLEYYNYGTTVTPKEWTTAGLIAALDVISLGGGSVLPANIVGRIINAGIPTGLAVLIAPDVIKTLGNPEAPVSEKVLAGAVEAALVLGGFLGFRPSKATLETIKPVGKVKAPVSAISIESPKVWIGVKLGDSPMIGISRGKIVFGKKGIEFPPLKEWELPGAEGAPFEPRTGLETKVFVNQDALTKAGMVGDEAEKFVWDIGKTLEQVKQFYGKKSPVMEADLLSKPIDTFSESGVRAILEWVSKNKKIVDRVFGSSTVRPQLTKEALAEWVKVFGRKPGDIDLMLKNVTPEQAEAAVKDLVNYIRANSSDKPFISPDRRTLVQNYSRSTGATRHAIDVHYPNEHQLTGISETASQFADRVYGLSKISPAVKVKIKGVGEVSVSRLSETGIGKAEQVIGWRREPTTGNVVLKTEAHRVKDYSDLYEIIKTYNGKEAADAWAFETGINKILAEYADKTTGASRLLDMKPEVNGIIGELDNATKGKITPNVETTLSKVYDDLLKIIKDNNWNRFKGEIPELEYNFRIINETIDRLLTRGYLEKADINSILKSIREISKDMDRLIKEYTTRDIDWAWVFKPSETETRRYPEYYTPVVSIYSKALLSALHSPVIGYTSMGQLVSIPSRIAPSLQPSLISPPVSPSIAPSVVISAPSPSRITPSKPSITPSRISPPVSVISPSLSPSEKPSSEPSPPPSPPPGPPPSGSPSPPYTPPPPSKPPKTPPPETPPPVLGRMLVTQSPTRQVIPEGSIAWAQGQRKGVRGMMVDQWYFIPPPYTQSKPISLSAPPKGAVNTDSHKPMETIQIVGRSRKGVPARVDVDLGWADIYVIRGQKIYFKSGGEKTNIGTRIDRATIGMDLGDGDLIVDNGELIPGAPVSMQGLNRYEFSNKASRRKVKRVDRTNTSVRSIRR